MASEGLKMDIDNTSSYDCIVIGAGISGISFAANLHDKGQKIVIIEKENRIGGHIQSYASKSADDFWFELGAHTCYNSYVSLLSILENKDLIKQLDKGSYITYSNGELKSIVSQVNYFSMLTHFFRYFTAERTGKTVEEYFTPIVGKKNYTKLFSRAFRAVICQPADSYPADLFLKRRNGRNEDYPRKFSFGKGISSFLQSVIDKNELEVIYNSIVSEIVQLEDGRYQLTSDNGSMLYAQRIAIATDSNTASSLLRPIEPEVSRILSGIEMSKSTTIAVVLKKESCNVKQIAGIIPMNDDFMSVVTRDLIAHDNLRAFVFHFIGDQATYESKKDEICKVLGIQPENIIEHTTMRHNLPALRKQHLEMEKQIQDARINDDIYLIGNYFYGLSLEDCVNRTIDEIRRYI